MENQWNDEWQTDSQVYTSSQIEGILNFCEIEVESENSNGFSAYCPFHNNRDSAAFGINFETGRWACFNPSCGSYGNLEDLIRLRKNMNPFETARVILRFQRETTPSPSQRLSAIREETPDFVEFPQEPVDRMHLDLMSSSRGLEYMTKQRGFELDTLKYFGIGYSVKKDMITVPMHDPTGMLVGFVGRSVADKKFKNTDKLPKSKTSWNYHRAKKHGEKVIIVESSFDAMRVHQAGYPNVIALLGGHLTSFQKQQIDKTWSSIILMTDFDKKQYPVNCRRCGGFDQCIGHRPGRDLGWSIAEKLSNKRIMWAAYDDNCVYPHNAKDAGDLTDDEIRHVLSKSISHFEYSRWDVENLV